MQFRALGPLVVEIGEGDVRPLRGRQGRLVAALIARHGDVVSTDRLIDAVWGEAPPKSARNAIQVYVSQVRAMLPPTRQGGTLLTAGDGYVLELETEELDITLVEALVEEARGVSDADGRAALLARALEWWRGRAFEPWDTDEDLRPEAVRLEELRLTLEEEHGSALVEAGRHAEVVDDLHGLADREPMRERRWGLLMLALHRNGRQAEALRTYQHVRRILGEELGIEPGADLRRLEERILLQDPTLDWAAPSSPRSNVPAPIGPLIGRDDEVAAVAEVVARGARLVAVLGPGGVGKTRLAIEVARNLEIVQRFERVVFVPLESVTAADDVEAHVVHTALGPTEGGVDLIDALEDRRWLMLLDNCEHLVEAIRSMLARLLPHAPNVSVMVTSRVPVALEGEARIGLAPLDPASSAGELFRLRAAEAGHVLPDDSADEIAAVCSALDGMPLAIELAAARLSILSLDELAERITDPTLLSDGHRPVRHRSVADAVAWSHALLDEDAQLALAALSVFRGGFIAGAAEHILHAVGIPAPLPVVAELHDASMLVRERARLRMLETVRRFAGDQLIQAGRASTAADALASWVLAHVAKASARLGTPDNLAAIRALDDERGNVAAALSHLAGSQSGHFVDAVTKLAEYWWRTGDLQLGDEWIASASRHPEAGPRLLRYAAMFLARVRPADDASELLDRLDTMRSPIDSATARAHVAWSRGDMVAARGLFETAADLQSQTHDVELIDTLVTLARVRLAEGDIDGALSQADRLEHMGRAGERADAAPLAAHVRGLALAFGGNFATATPHLEAAATGFAELGMERQLVGAQRGLGVARAHQGDLESARSIVTDSLERATRIGDVAAVGFGRAILALVAVATGDTDTAAGLLDRALRQAHLERDEQLAAWGLYGVAEVALAEGDAPKSAALLGASDRIVAHWRLGEPSRTWHTDDPLSERLERSMGSELAAHYHRGHELDLVDAVELALGYPVGWIRRPEPRR